MADDFLGCFDFGDDEQDDAQAGDGSAATGAREEPLAQRHARESKALKERAREMRAGAKKSERAVVTAQIDSLEAEQRGRHAREAAEDALGGLSLDGRGKLAKGGGGGAGKPSKAAAKKQKEDAAREARMAEARSTAGPNKGALESAQLVAQLAPLGLRVAEVGADGHCLFRAVGVQLEAAAQGALSDEAVWALRRQAVAHIRAHAAEYAPFFEPTETAPTLADYCAQMASEAVWGGQMELRALAQALGRTIRVHAAGAPPVVMNQAAAAADGSSPSAIELSFHQHAYGLGEHYNAVRPIH
jgi:OTU domain-containing protein 6